MGGEDFGTYSIGGRLALESLNQKRAEGGIGTAAKGIDDEVQKVPFEIAFGVGSPFESKYDWSTLPREAQRRITADHAKWLAEEAALETGVKVEALVTGTGPAGWGANPNAILRLRGTRGQVASAADLIALGAQQTSVPIVSDNPQGAEPGIDVIRRTQGSRVWDYDFLDQVRDEFTRRIGKSPQDFTIELNVSPNNEPMVKLYAENDEGRATLNDKRLVAGVRRTLREVVSDLDVGSNPLARVGRYDIEFPGNDWRANPNGEEHRARLEARGHSRESLDAFVARVSSAFEQTWLRETSGPAGGTGVAPAPGGRGPGPGVVPGSLGALGAAGPPGSRPRPSRQQNERTVGDLAATEPAPPYYSHARRVVEGAPQGTQSGDAWVRFLTDPKHGVTKAEMKWSNLGEMLKSRGAERVTRDEIIEHLDANRLELREVEKFGADAKYGPDQAGDDYTTPGAQNYREVVIYRPNGRAEFRSNHFPDEPSPILHLRLSDRTLQGKRTLVLEELQSDWAQRGREAGFYRGSEEMPPLKAHRKGSGLWEIVRTDTGESLGRQLADTAEAAIAQYTELREPSYVTGRVPEAPFVTDTSKWTTLGLKRVLKFAADEGYDAIAIVPGKEQAKRYSLIKHISKIEYRPNEGYLDAWNLQGKKVVTGTMITPEMLPAHIGKEATRKLLSSPATPEGTYGDPVHQLSGLDLEVGGEGMEGFYDKIVPEQLNKLAKEYGVKVQLEGGNVKGPIPEDEAVSGAWLNRLTPQQRQRFEELGRRWEAGTLRRDSPEFKEWQELSNPGDPIPIHTLEVPEHMKKQIRKKGFPLYSRNTLGGMAAGANA